MADDDLQFPWALPAVCRSAPIAYVEVERDRVEIGERGETAWMGTLARAAFFDARPWLGNAAPEDWSGAPKASFAGRLPAGARLLRWDPMPAPGGGWALAVLVAAKPARGSRLAEDDAEREALAVLASLGSALGEPLDVVVPATRVVSDPESDWVEWSLAQLDRSALDAVAARVEAELLSGAVREAGSAQGRAAPWL